MTQVIPIRPNTSETNPNAILRYTVAMSKPESHLFEIRLQVSQWQAKHLDLTFPVWTPGSYLVREYARNVQDFAAQTPEGTTLAWRKVSKHQWQIETDTTEEIVVSYRLFANELTVRTNHLDGTHGYFNGAATFFFIPGFEDRPIEVAIALPHSDWQIATTLSPVPEVENTFVAEDFDTLVDSPFEIGIQERREFEIFGKSHELVVWGQGNLDLDRLIEEIDRIVRVEAQLFGGLPYDRYLFILHLSGSGFGGLEHKNSCSLNYPRLGFQKADSYNRFLQLVAHEFFHLWNVKRIRPKALERFDYTAENYTPSLWFCEGVTSYYDMLLPLWANLYDAKSFLKIFSKDVTRFFTTPGRFVQPLSESSWDAWIKLYRRDANSDNSQISYYLKGELVSLMLDLTIRQKSDNTRSIDDVMKQVWQQFGKDEIGYTPEQLQEAFEFVAGCQLDNFFDRYIHGTEELPLAEFLEPFGLSLKTDTDKQPPFWGVRVNGNGNGNGNGTTIKFVEIDSPAQQAGLDAGDELLAIDGFRVSSDAIADRLKDYKPGDTISVSVFHQDELKTVSVTLAKPQPSNYRVVPVKNPTLTQAKNFQAWLGADITTVS
ncbi:peptidase M61 [Leptolyngbya valderiana BDU 20041]|nr:M61 family metallopeptidase [Geitlerinema sp. CS-897]OAB60341.1 peptidase M61 [Leptolyngbya valderiana BDU 20041]